MKKNTTILLISTIKTLFLQIPLLGTCFKQNTKLLFLLFSMLLFGTTLAQTVKNPRTLPDEWELYGVGDPYLLKYKGKYWLYASTRNDKIGVKVWSTWDLVNWKYEGLCTTEEVTHRAYAPEVFYINGSFYMYTSPKGDGHYILKADSPKGPFTVETGNLGLTIDGNVFSDDDGSLYFYYAGNAGGIKGRRMSGPLSINGPQILTGAFLDGWTEGSTVFKRNGVYYMTYTGNHIISKGYRVHYGTADSPLGPFKESNQGPIVLNTEGPFYGLGHSGTFRGPDLDTWYMAYHNRYGKGSFGPFRALNIDPHGFNGEKLVVYGPCNWVQPAPNLPDFYDRFDRVTIGSNWENTKGGNWGIYNQELMWQNQTGTGEWHSQISNAETGEDFSAEFNMKEVSRGGATNSRYGAVFCYQDESNYARAVFSSFDNTITVQTISGGSINSTDVFPMLPGWKYRGWHAIRVEKKASHLKVYVDDMLKFSKNIQGLSGGKIGVTTMNSHADFGYTAFSNHVDGTGIFDFHKPVPGIIEAVHYNSGVSAYQDNTSGNTGGQYRNGDVDIRVSPEGGYNVGWNSSGESYTYNINVERTGSYHLGLRYATTRTDATVRFLCDGNVVADEVPLPSTDGWNEWQTKIIKNLSLPQGFHTLTMETVSGEFDFYTFNFEHATNEESRLDQFTTGFSGGWNYSDGSWSVSNGTSKLNGWGKRMLGNTGWTDYAVEVDMQCPTQGNAGLVFRVQNPAEGRDGIKHPQLGTDFYQGYYIGMQSGGIHLGKQNYNWEGLQFYGKNFSPGRWYKVRTIIKGNLIKVFVDDMETPIIEYFDPSPMMAGKAGLRAFNITTATAFDNFRIYTIDCNDDLDGTAGLDVCGTCSGGNTGIDPVEDISGCVTGSGTVHSKNSMHLYPNPVMDELHIEGVVNDIEVEITDLSGKLILKQNVSGSINVSSLQSGIYLLKVNGKVSSFIKQ